MSYARSIRSYIAKMPLNVILSTRDVLSLGTRNAVDLTLSRLVKASTLIRVARGLFVREGSNIPDAKAIAQAKARAFGRCITSHGSTEAQRFGLPCALSENPKFCIGGGSSSFLSVHERIVFAGTCDRKRHLEDSSSGKIIRGFWHAGKQTFLEKAQELIDALPNLEQTNLTLNAAWMPAWMSDQFVRRSSSTVTSISLMPLPPVLDIQQP